MLQLTPGAELLYSMQDDIPDGATLTQYRLELVDGTACGEADIFVRAERLRTSRESAVLGLPGYAGGILTVTVEIQSPLAVDRLTLVDVAGRQVGQAAGRALPAGRTVLNLEAPRLQSGFYFLRATCTSGRSYTARIILSR